MKCQYVKLNKGRNDPLLIEKRRDKFARLKEYKELVKTYSSDLSEVEDENTGEFWNLLNEKGTFDHESPITKHKIRIVSQLVPNGVKVLDIGFGTSVLERKLKDFGKNLRLYGIDISDFSVRKARQMFPEWIFESGNILNIPFNKSSFDCVIALEVLEHISPSQLFRALDEIKRVLIKNGILIISVPLNEDLKQLLKEGKNPNAHLREYTPYIIKSELEIAGFSVISEKYLFAFKKNYFIKNFIIKFIFPRMRRPNDLIIVARRENELKVLEDYRGF